MGCIAERLNYREKTNRENASVVGLGSIAQTLRDAAYKGCIFFSSLWAGAGWCIGPVGGEGLGIRN